MEDEVKKILVLFFLTLTLVFMYSNIAQISFSSTEKLSAVVLGAGFLIPAIFYIEKDKSVWLGITTVFLFVSLYIVGEKAWRLACTISMTLALLMLYFAFVVEKLKKRATDNKSNSGDII